MMKLLLTLCALASLTTQAATFKPPASAPQLKQALFTQMIDHNNASAGSFQQRYWIDSEFASGTDAPVFLRICGEANGEQFIPDITPTYAKQFHGYIIYLEHRFYGQSQPFADLSSAHLEYMTIDNVIADIANFQTSITTSNHWTGKWISLGGSYSGTLSAIYRSKHPELVVGALAASAPMFENRFPDEGADGDNLSSTKISDYPADDRQWAYEACTSFNFWEYIGNGKIVEPSASLCQQAFGVTTPVDIDSFNHNYFDPVVTAGSDSASNILFTSGSNDPWNQLSVNASNNHNNNVAIQLINGAGHHFDLNAPTSSDSSAVLAARQLFSSMVTKWLAN